MELTLTAANAILKMLVMMLVGVLASKVNLLSEDDTKTITRVVVNIIAPALVLSSFLTPYDPEKLSGFLYAVFFGFILHFVGILIAYILIPKKDNDNWEVERMSVIYKNVGFMGIPLATAILGTESLIYVAAVNIVFNIMIWSHGITLIRGTFNKQELIKLLKEPNMLVVFIGIFIYAFRIPIPEIISYPITTIGNCTTPLAMIIAGFMLARSNLLALLTNPRTYYISFLNLIVVPFFMIFILRLFPLSDLPLLSVYITSTCPVAAMVTMMAINNHKSPSYTSGLFAIGTLFSLITIPLMMLLYSIIP